MTTSRTTGKTAKSQPPASDFMRMAEERGLSDNALFLSTLDTYKLQLDVIDSIRKEIQSGGTTVDKEYVKNRRNLYIHPAVKELPRHVDSANKTAAMLLDIIKNLGAAKQQKSKLAEMQSDE